jgi:hypothetical protein
VYVGRFVVSGSSKSICCLVSDHNYIAIDCFHTELEYDLFQGDQTSRF